MKRHDLVLFALGLSGAASSLAACSPDTATPATSSAAAGGGDDGGGGSDDDGRDDDGRDDDGDDDDGGSGVCLLHNCATDDQCDGCAEGRTYCKVDEGRCVACGTGGECPDGQDCSSFGQCVPEGLTCEADAAGTPTIACQTSADCLACDPAHQVCETNTATCVACTATDTSECQSTDICRDGQCAQACSSDCETANDCTDCEGAKACANHKCSECSDTYACPAGQYCTDNGTCASICGSVEAPGVCNFDADCNGCGNVVATDNEFVCNTPINGGAGECIPVAAGCSDLGGVALPPPYNEVTNTCSGDADCANVGVEYNVGKALRELTGFGEPGDFVEIADANVEYPMPVCATILTVPGGGEDPIECGLCVPCRQDSDCQDIDIDGLTGQLFPGLAGAAVAVALDYIFGPNDRKIYLYCETVAAGYGACLPCPGLLNDCGVDGGGGGGGGTCDHPTDQAGTPLDPSCDDCAASVCAFDSFCCETEWDDACVDQAAATCSTDSCHDVCEVGGPLGPSCGDCASQMCDFDAYCCDTSWDSQCIAQADELCGSGCLE